MVAAYEGEAVRERCGQMVEARYDLERLLHEGCVLVASTEGCGL